MSHNFYIVELWIPGKHRWRWRAKSVLCYWANRQLEVSTSELFRRMNVSVMTISNAVQRGEKVVKELKISFFRQLHFSSSSLNFKCLERPVNFPKVKGLCRTPTYDHTVEARFLQLRADETTDTSVTITFRQDHGGFSCNR